MVLVHPPMPWGGGGMENPPRAGGVLRPLPENDSN